MLIRVILKYFDGKVYYSLKWCIET